MRTGTSLTDAHAIEYIDGISPDRPCGRYRQETKYRMIIRDSLYFWKYVDRHILPYRCIAEDIQCRGIGPFEQGLERERPIALVAVT